MARLNGCKRVMHCNTCWRQLFSNFTQPTSAQAVELSPHLGTQWSSTFRTNLYRVEPGDRSFSWGFSTPWPAPLLQTNRPVFILSLPWHPTKAGSSPVDVSRSSDHHHLLLPNLNLSWIVQSANDGSTTWDSYDSTPIIRRLRWLSRIQLVQTLPPPSTRDADTGQEADTPLRCVHSHADLDLRIALGLFP